MSLDTLRDALPAYAKDISLNLSSLASETVLNDQQKWGAFVASAHAIGVPAVVQAVDAAAGWPTRPSGMRWPRRCGAGWVTSWNRTFRTRACT